MKDLSEELKAKARAEIAQSTQVPTVKDYHAFEPDPKE